MILPVYSFKARFTDGMMKGLTLNQEMTFTGEAEAFDWAVRVNKNNRNGNCDFWVTDLEKSGVKEVDWEKVL
jgi:hypothetical protein